MIDPAASAPSPHGDPAPTTALPSSGSISTRTRRRTAAAAGAEPPAVDNGFGLGGAPRPPARRANTPARVLRPQAPLAVAAAPAPAALPAPTVPIPSGRDRAEPVGTPLTSRPPQRLTWLPSALLPSHSSGIPPRAIRTLIGRGKNGPSLRATPPCDTSLSTGRQPYQTTYCRVFLRTSAPPSRRFRNLLATAVYTLFVIAAVVSTELHRTSDWTV